MNAEVLAGAALACRDSERLQFRYRKTDGQESQRLVEPARLLQRYRRWYLDAWDLDRGDWRRFRLNRVSALLPTGRRFEPRQVPTDTDAVPSAPAVHARIRIHASLQSVQDHIGAHTTGPITADGDDTFWDISSPTVQQLAGALVWLPWRFEVHDGPELIAFLDAFRARLHEALPGGYDRAEPGVE